MNKPLLLVLWIVLSSTTLLAETLDRRLSKLEESMRGMARKSGLRKVDGIIPERTVVYKTSNRCKEIKKTKMYFDATHAFDILARVVCANRTFLVVRWYEKDFSPEITINTVLQDDIILSRNR